MKVWTTKGEIDRDELVVTDEITEEDNARVFATSWHHNGELVRRDVNVNILRGLELKGEQQDV